MIVSILSPQIPRITSMSRPTAVVALLFLARHVLAHEHHEEDIPEGEGVSAEPIVYYPYLLSISPSPDIVP